MVFHNAGNGYCVLKVVNGFDSFNATGNAIFTANPEGSLYTFKGEWGSHPRFGRQFVFSSLEPEGGQLWFFLAKVVKGLGDKLASLVIDTFGDETSEVIEHEPWRLLEVKGIGEKKLDQVVNSWAKYAPIRKLAELLIPHGVTQGMVVHIFNSLGDTAVAKVEESPYCLTTVPGIGFKRADRVAMAMGVASDSPARVEECIKYVLGQRADSAGDTVMLAGEVVTKVLEETAGEDKEHAVSAGLAADVIETMKATGALVGLPGGVALAQHHHIEQRIVQLLQERQKLPKIPLMPAHELDKAIQEMEREMRITLSPEQRGAVELVASGERTVVVAGFAGSGKTTVSRVILSLFARVYGRDSIMCCALSGIAADRIRKVSGFSGNTIHTTLGFSGSDFTYSAKNPLPYQVVALDEGSMVSGWLYYRLLSAIHAETVFLQFGDPAQLPPIGAADPFADCIDAELCPVVRLTKIYRQKSDSVLLEFANTIRKAQVPPNYKNGGYSDFCFTDKSIPNWYRLKNTLPQCEQDRLRDENNAEILANIKEECRQLRPSVRNVITDFQCLSPMRKGPLGTESLNRAVQEVFNPPVGQAEVSRFGIVFREQDKVVHVQNKNMRVFRGIERYLAEKGNVAFQEECRVFNGSVGILHRLDLNNEDAYVIFPAINLVVTYDFLHLGDIIELAWCLTVHKVQGSEVGWVIMPVTTGAFMMMNNKLLYTALTRAKQRAVLIGQAFMFERACKNLDETKRKTVFQELMQAGG